MGIEYSIRFESRDLATTVPTILERLCGAPNGTHYECRTNTASSMADASVMIVGGGLYFCDNGGSGREFLGRLVAALVSAFGVIQVQEYE